MVRGRLLNVSGCHFSFSFFAVQFITSDRPSIPPFFFLLDFVAAEWSGPRVGGIYTVPYRGRSALPLPPALVPAPPAMTPWVSALGL